MMTNNLSQYFCAHCQREQLGRPGIPMCCAVCNQDMDERVPGIVTKMQIETAKILTENTGLSEENVPFARRPGRPKRVG